MDSVKDRIKNLGYSSEQKTALLLAQAGGVVNERIFHHTGKLVKKYSQIPAFNLAIVESLVWAKYAKREDRFFDLALRYLQMGDSQIFKEIKSLAWRFGPESLMTILISWKVLLDGLGSIKLPQQFSTEELIKFQQEQVLTKAGILSQTSRLRLIGAWTFCGPFKILAGYQRGLWDDPKLDEVWMPLGLQVVRGLRFLHKQGFRNINMELLDEEEPGLITGLGTVVLAQQLQKRFADLAGSRVLHINSGLFLLGKGEDEVCVPND